MRRFDKNENIRKANLIAEQRYLESKGLIKEGNDGDEAFKWFDSVNIPNFDDYQGIQNLPSNKLVSPDMNGYLPYVRGNVDSRDWGMHLGDSVMSILKDRYESRINSIGDPRVRNFLQNPQVIDASDDEEDVRNAVEANKFIASIPNNPDAKYLMNDSTFSERIATTIDNMIEECLERNYKKLIPLILPWLAYSWRRSVTDNRSDGAVTNAIKRKHS